MLTTIKDPRIANGFSMLANVLGGGQSAQTAINADLAARKRDLLVAQTEMQRRQEQELRNRMADTTMLQSDIAGTTDYTDPAKMALILSNLPGMGVDAMKAGPGFIAGAGSLVDPNFRNADDFSKVLLGTGVTSNYANTPAGMAAGHENDIALRQMQEEGLMARQNDQQDFRVQYPALGQGGAGAPPAVNPKTTDDLWSMVAGRLGLSQELAADPATQNMILPRLVEVYQQTKNAEAAIQQVMKEFTVREESDRGIMPWNWFDTKQVIEPSAPVGAPPPAAPAADNPGAGAAPAPASGTYPDGTIIKNPQTGQRMIRKGGQWVEYQG